MVIDVIVNSIIYFELVITYKWYLASLFFKLSNTTQTTKNHIDKNWERAWG